LSVSSPFDRIVSACLRCLGGFEIGSALWEGSRRSVRVIALDCWPSFAALLAHSRCNARLISGETTRFYCAYRAYRAIRSSIFYCVSRIARYEKNKKLLHYLFFIPLVSRDTRYAIENTTAYRAIPAIRASFWASLFWIAMWISVLRVLTKHCTATVRISATRSLHTLQRGFFSPGSRRVAAGASGGLLGLISDPGAVS